MIGAESAQVVDLKAVAMKLLVGGSVCGSVTVLWFLLKFVETDPKLVTVAVQQVASWGPLFVLALVFAVIADRRSTENAKIMRDSAQAQQTLAIAVQKIADKDDRQLMEIQTLAGYNADMNARIHKRMDSQDQMLMEIRAELRVRTPKPEERSGAATA